MKTNKNKIILIAILAILLIISIMIFRTIILKEDSLYINGNEIGDNTYELEYNKNIDNYYKDIILQNKEDDKFISLDYKIKEIDNIIGKQKIILIYNEEEIEININIIDTIKPTISGEESYTLEYGSEFDARNLDIEILDNYSDLIDITFENNVDTSKAGTYKLEVIAIDESNNKTSKEFNIIIEEDNTVIDVDNNSYITILNNPEDIKTCVTREYRLPDGWAPSDLVYFGNHALRAEAYKAYNSMYNAAKADGVNMILISSYRSQSYQTNLFNNYYANDPVNANTYSAFPRTSEHELGLAIDISYDGSINYDLHEHAIGKWMDKNAHLYGWTLSFPDGKTQITGYVYEPWHYRYVGVELAKYLKDNNLTLIEYTYNN